MRTFFADEGLRWVEIGEVVINVSLSECKVFIALQIRKNKI